MKDQTIRFFPRSRSKVQGPNYWEVRFCPPRGMYRFQQHPKSNCIAEKEALAHHYAFDYQKPRGTPDTHCGEDIPGCKRCNMWNPIPENYPDLLGEPQKGPFITLDMFLRMENFPDMLVS